MQIQSVHIFADMSFATPHKFQWLHSCDQMRLIDVYNYLLDEERVLVLNYASWISALSVCVCACVCSASRLPLLFHP